MRRFAPFTASTKIEALLWWLDAPENKMRYEDFQAAQRLGGPNGVACGFGIHAVTGQRALQVTLRKADDIDAVKTEIQSVIEHVCPHEGSQEIQVRERTSGEGGTYSLVRTATCQWELIRWVYGTRNSIVTADLDTILRYIQNNHWANSREDDEGLEEGFGTASKALRGEE